MTNIWPLAVAQTQLRAVIDRAATGQAQIITTQGEPAAVVLSYAEYQRLTAPALSLLEFFQTCPLEADEELDITRDRSGLRSDICW
jgi:prevent-host-death family protein